MEALTASISVEGLRKSFGGLLVLDGVTFTVDRGELCCVLGPSGCGKTTLLRIIAGLLGFDSGRVVVEGVEVRPGRRAYCEVGVVFQEPRLLKWRTVRENVRLGLELRKGRLSAEDEVAVDECLKLVGLDGYADAYPHELSGGMRQRVALARALAVKPRVLLMDEPLTGLDVRARRELQDEILRVWRREGLTVLFVTHDLREAIYLAEKIVVFSDKPTKVKAVVPVDLPRPRDLSDPACARLEEEVRGLFYA